MSLAQERFSLQWGLDLSHEPREGRSDFIPLNPICQAQKAANEQPAASESSIPLSKSSYQTGLKAASKGARLTATSEASCRPDGRGPSSASVAEGTSWAFVFALGSPPFPQTPDPLGQNPGHHKNHDPNQGRPKVKGARRSFHTRWFPGKFPK